MDKLTELTYEEYDGFVNTHNKSHFLQSYEWGQFCKDQKGQIPHYVGLKKDGKVVAACLILAKKTPLKYYYGYSPRGFILDYEDFDLIKEFTSLIKDYMKENKYIYIKFDPDIKYQDIDENANPIEGGFNNYKLYDYMLSLGYKHTGFYKNYDGNQPRFTFRINLKRNWEDIEAVFNKSFQKSIRRSYNYELEIDNEPNYKAFFELHQKNSDKDDFNAHSEKYFEDFTNDMKDKVKYFNAYIYPKKLTEKFANEIKDVEKELETNQKRKKDLEDQLVKLKKDYEEFKNIKEEKLMVCSLICTYTKNRAWSFFIGNDQLGNTTFAVSRCYYEAIKDAFDNGYEFFDLFGTVGDPNTKVKNLAKLHDFKRKFGDEYVEFIGEFDLVNKKFMYKILPILLKVYRKIRR
ncbi:MAG: peptidoglycan bridge formation glycyltransferase FemA/FemB family protein [Bacilli bacterium]|nr:peptidoglycan bridge formation glycyltransferase FemA/FemB family protein [Bacilli bacterium]